MRAIIFVNGQFHHPEIARNIIRPDDYIIAVNGGTLNALKIEVIPHIIIGDLDSFPPEEKTRLQASHVTFLQHPVKKDATDLELAIRHTLEKKITDIVLLAALGGRIDQCFANLFLLTLPGLEGTDVKIVDGAQTAFVIREQAVIHGTPGDTVSLLPIGGDAAGVSNEGLEWPLYNETLPLGTTRGISNVLLNEQARICVEQGLVLCVVTDNRIDVQHDS